MPTYESFGGKNKARRLAKAVKKGKTAKAEKLAKKVANKVQKLIDKGKTSKKRYEFLTKKLTEAGEDQMSIKELEEVENITEEATADDPTVDVELQEAEDDKPDGTVAKGVEPTEELTESKRWVKILPNWATIAIPSAVTLGIVAWIVIPKLKKQ